MEMAGKRLADQAREKVRQAYNAVYSTLKPFALLLYPLRCEGRENIPEGPAIVCANHSNYVDPVLIAMSFGRRHMLRFMAKKELFSVPVLGPILRKIGVFPVNRGASDIDAVRTTMKCLKSGDKVLIFPEGTRVSEDDAVAAKTGAVRIASRTKAPIIPVFVPRRKKLFGRVRVRIGKPYYVHAETHEDYLRCADELMARIRGLGDQS